jgi:hypothetical protein
MVSEREHVRESWSLFSFFHGSLRSSNLQKYAQGEDLDIHVDSDPPKKYNTSIYTTFLTAYTSSRKTMIFLTPNVSPFSALVDQTLANQHLRPPLPHLLMHLHVEPWNFLDDQASILKFSSSKLRTVLSLARLVMFSVLKVSIYVLREFALVSRFNENLNITEASQPFFSFETWRHNLSSIVTQRSRTLRFPQSEYHHRSTNGVVAVNRFVPFVGITLG